LLPIDLRLDRLDFGKQRPNSTRAAVTAARAPPADRAARSAALNRASVVTSVATIVSPRRRLSIQLRGVVAVAVVLGERRP
jgi:hypothetical protein